MALGDSYSSNNNNKKQYREPEVYSCYNMSNVEGIDPSALSFSFFRNLLKIQIAPKLPNATSGSDKMWDHENAVNVYLTHTKARMLRDEIERVLRGEKFNGGVSTGADGLVSFSDGKEIGSSFYCLIIRKIDENGQIVSTYAYEFKTQYHYAISNFDAKTSKHEKDYFDMLEIDQLKTLLEDYYTAMTNALAYTVVNNQRFDVARINTKLNDLCQANGISYDRQNGGNQRRGSFFSHDTEKEVPQPNRSQGSNIRSTTIDDLEASMGADEE